MAESIKQVAETYLQLSDSEDDEDNSGLESLKEKVNKWKEKMDKLNEEDPLHEVAESEYQEAKQEMEKIKKSRNQLEKTRDALLEEISSKFVPKDEWLDTEVIKAVNKVLTGERNKVLHVNDKEIDSNYSGESEDLFDISERVRRLADDMLEGNEEVKGFWDKFKNQKKFDPFKAVAKAGEKLDRGQIADLMERDVGKGKIGNNIRNTIHQTDFNPYHREGGYSLSVTGKYLKKNYMNLTGEQEAEQQDQEEETEETVEQSSEDKSKQQKFYDTVSE